MSCTIYMFFYQIFGPLDISISHHKLCDKNNVLLGLFFVVVAHCLKSDVVHFTLFHCYSKIHPRRTITWILSGQMPNVGQRIIATKSWRKWVVKKWRFNIAVFQRNVFNFVSHIFSFVMMLTLIFWNIQFSLIKKPEIIWKVNQQKTYHVVCDGFWIWIWSKWDLFGFRTCFERLQLDTMTISTLGPGLLHIIQSFSFAFLYRSYYSNSIRLPWQATTDLYFTKAYCLQQ